VDGNVRDIVLAVASALRAEHCSFPLGHCGPYTLIIETVDMATQRTGGVSIRGAEKSVLCLRATAHMLKYLPYKYVYMLGGGVFTVIREVRQIKNFPLQNSTTWSSLVFSSSVHISQT
jgi:hypothetical protein